RLAFARDQATGRLRWRRFLATPTGRYVDIAPQVARGTVYVSTIGEPPNGRGTLYALDAATGKVRWKLDTIKGRWRVPAEAGGGGAWWTPSGAGSAGFLGHATSPPSGRKATCPNSRSTAPA